MDNFLFQKLMNAKKEESEIESTTSQKIEILDEKNEENIFIPTSKQETDNNEEGYIARKNNE